MNFNQSSCLPVYLIFIVIHKHVGWQIGGGSLELCPSSQLILSSFVFSLPTSIFFFVFQSPFDLVIIIIPHHSCFPLLCSSLYVWCWSNLTPINLKLSKRDLWWSKYLFFHREEKLSRSRGHSMRIISPNAC